MSDDALIAAADLETVRQLRAALDVAMQENEQHNAYERTLESKFGQLSRQLGEQNTTIGYQDAMIAAMRTALDQIDRHVVGAYETDSGSVEPCDECGEMREIASQALALIKKV